MDLGNFLHDVPRHLLISGKQSGRRWEVLSDIDSFFSPNPSEASLWRISFEQRKLKALKLEQMGSHSLFDWSIAELRVFAPPK
jgi:hypothetical protein